MKLSRGRGRLGILVPFTNTNLEADMSQLCPQGVVMHYARMGGYDLDEIPDENQMANMGAADLSEPLRLIAGVKPDVILYGCTSATLTHGVEFDQLLSKNIMHDLGIPTITAAGALVQALNSLSIKNIGFASPYVKNINKAAIDFLHNAGFNVVSSADITSKLDNYGQGNLSPDQVCELARQADCDSAQAIVLSCTDMRAVETVSKLEAEINKPIITSNQALLFSALSHLNIPAAEIDCGCLFKQENQ